MLNGCVGQTRLLLQQQITVLHLEMLLTLTSVNRHWETIRAWGCIQSWILVHVLKQQCLTDSWFIV